MIRALLLLFALVAVTPAYALTDPTGACPAGQTKSFSWGYGYNPNSRPVSVPSGSPWPSFDAAVTAWSAAHSGSGCLGYPADGVWGAASVATGESNVSTAALQSLCGPGGQGYSRESGYFNRVCTPCPSPKEVVNGQCVDPCPTGATRDASGMCQCPAGQSVVNGQCQIVCDEPKVNQGGQCVCPAGTEDWNGQCKAPCQEGEQRNAQGECVGPECPEDKIGKEGVTVNQTYEQNGNDFCLSGTHCRISSTLLHSTSLAFDCSALGTPGGVCVPTLKTYAYRYKIVGTDSQFCAPSSPKAIEDVGPPEVSETSHDGTEVKTTSNGTVSFVSMAKPGGIYSAGDGPDNGVPNQPAVPSAAINNTTNYYNQTTINNSTNKSPPDGPNNPNNPNNQPNPNSNTPPTVPPNNSPNSPTPNNPDAGCAAGQKRNTELGNCVCVVGTKDEFNRCIGDNGCPIGQVKNNSGQCVSGTTGGQCPTGYVCSAPDGVCTPSQHQQSGMWDVDCVNEGGGNDGASLSGGQNCDSPPTCAGDPVGCFMSRQAWSTACSLLAQPLSTEQNTAIRASLDEGLGISGQTQAQRGGLLQAVGQHDVGAEFAGVLGSNGGGCLSDLTIPVNFPGWSTTVNVPMSHACLIVRILRFMLLASAAFGAMRIVIGGFE